jgi:hypothetical protein
MNASWVCSNVITHELNVAALRRLNNAWFACDAGGGSGLQNKKGGGSHQRVKAAMLRNQ